MQQDKQRYAKHLCVCNPMLPPFNFPSARYKFDIRTQLPNAHAPTMNFALQTKHSFLISTSPLSSLLPQIHPSPLPSLHLFLHSPPVPYSSTSPPPRPPSIAGRPSST